MTDDILTGNYIYLTCHHAQYQGPGTGAPKWSLIYVDTPVLFMFCPTKMWNLKVVYHASEESQQIQQKKTFGWL